MALLREPIVKPLNTPDGRWGPNDGTPKPKAFFYFVKDGENWGTVAAKDGWHDVKAFIRFNFGTDDPLEVNWFLKNYVGCKLQTDDQKNYRFSSSASPGYIFTRSNHQPANQPIGNGPPMPNGSPMKDETKLKQTYGPAKPWFVVGGKAGGMVGPLGGDLLALVGVSMSGPLEGFIASGATSRVGVGLGASAGFNMGIVSHMQHPNQLLDYRQPEPSWDASVALGVRAGDLHLLGHLFQQGGPLHGIASKMARMVATGTFGTSNGVVTMLNSLKGMAQSAGGLFSPKGSFDALIVDVPFGGIGTELSVFKARTTFCPLRTVTRGTNGDLEDITIVPDWMYSALK